MAKKEQYQVAVVNEINISKTGVTIALGEDTSTILDCGATSPTGIILPSNWTACNLSFHVCKTPNGTFVPLTNFDATPLQLVTDASMWIPLQPAQFNSILYVKLVCDDVQAEDVTVDFSLAPIYQGLHS